MRSFIMILSFFASRHLSFATDLRSISNIRSDLAYVTGGCTLKLAESLRNEIKLLNAIVSSQTDLLSTIAMQELATPIAQANQTIKSSCLPGCTFDELFFDIDSKFYDLTRNLSHVGEELNNEITVDYIELLGREIAHLASDCDMSYLSYSTSSFASATNCFVKRITEMNLEIKQELSRAWMLLNKSRKSLAVQYEEALNCTKTLVGEIRELLNESMEIC